MGDAIRNIIGTLIHGTNLIAILSGDGAFTVAGEPRSSVTVQGNGPADWHNRVFFDASYVVSTANENRVRTISARHWRRVA